MHQTSKLFAAVLMGLAALSFSACGGKEPQPTPEPEKPVEVGSPVIKVEAASLAAAAGTYEIPVTIENPVNGSSLSAKLGEEADWISLGTPTSTAIPVTLSDNLSGDRSVSVTLSYKDAQDVTIQVTQKQWDYNEFTISVSEIGPFGAKFDITRKSGYAGGYFFEVLDKAAFSKYVADEKNKIGDFAYGEALYQSDLNYLNNLAARHGHPLKDLFTMLQSMYSKDNTVSIPYSGLAVNTDYVFIVYGMEEGTAVRKTPMCFYEFKTGFSTESALSFTGIATDVTENYAEITVTPSNNSEYWYLNWVSEIELKSTTIAEVMQNSINTAKSYLSRYTVDDLLCHGPETQQATDLMPGTEYTVIAWGMDPEKFVATTEPKEVFKFKTKEFEIVDDCTFNIEVLEIEDMDVRVKVTPSNLSTRYYVAFVEASRMAGYSDEQAAQRIINMEASRIEQHYYDVENLSWANLPGLEAGVRDIWGRRNEGWTFQPNHDYNIYVFGIDNFGIRSTVVARKDVTTAEPGTSNNHFSVTFDKASWQGVDFTVTPEIQDEYWMPFFIEKAELAHYRNADGSLQEKEVMHEIEEYYEDEILYHTYKGTRTLHEHVVPDTQYTLLVFGYSGSNTTQMYEFDVYAPEPPLGKSTADYTYTYELFRGEDLTALDPLVWPEADYKGDCVMVSRITPTENAVHWYWGIWPPEDNFKDQGGKYYLMTLDMNPDVSGSAMQDQKFHRTRPWWYGATEGYKWVDSDGDIVNHYPWSISGWAEDADGNYGPWHYELFIPVPVPKGEETGKYEVGYTKAYNFWSAPNQTANMRVFRVSDGKDVRL